MIKSNLLLAAAFGMVTLVGAGLATAQDYVYVTDNTGTGGSGDGLSIINATVPGSTPQTITSATLDDPTGIALDPTGKYAGDLFIASPANDALVIYDPTNESFTKYATNADLGSAEGLAFDSSGDLYIASSPSTSTGNIYEYTSSALTAGTTTPTAYTALSTLGGPEGIAVDANGDLFVTITTPSGNGPTVAKTSQVVEITPGGTINAFYPGTVNPPNPALAGPVGIAFNTLPTNGNLYIANSGANTVTQSTLYPVGSTAVSTGKGLLDPQGLIFDSNGNLFVADYGSPSDEVTEYTVSSTPGVYNLYSTYTGGGLSGPDFLAVDTVGLPVPEPSTYALLLSGLGMLLFVIRQRRSPVAAKL
jgi:sugar lactone lactonase YvrE